MKTIARLILLALAVPILLRLGDAALENLADALGSLSRPGGQESAKLVDVVDGDTIKVELAGRVETVRLIGLDTPEVYGGVECGGEAASTSMKRLAERGGEVELVADASQDRRDRYGRLLRYAELDGVDLAREQLRRGWAEVYVYGGVRFDRADDYENLAAGARRHGRGAWRLCGGNFHRP